MLAPLPRTGVLRVAILAALAAVGCVGTPAPGERAARAALDDAAARYRPDGRRPALPALSTNAAFADYLRHALLASPQVEAAYFDWRASVERITQARSRPDPQLVFQADIASTVMSLMPGLMTGFPPAGKLGLQGEAAAAESDAAYAAFAAAARQAALETRRVYIQLHFLGDTLRVTRDTLAVATAAEAAARQQNAVGRATLQDALRAQMDQDRLAAEIANLEDSRAPLLAAFAAALGLPAGAPPPPLPARFESAPLDGTVDARLDEALARHPRLKGMQADVRRADAAIRLADKARLPDINLGAMVEVRASPVFVRPQGSVTLPIWRDRIAAQIAEAHALKSAAEARLALERARFAVDVAEKVYLAREAGRMTALLRDTLLPKAHEALDLARAAYAGGDQRFADVVDAWRTTMTLEREGIDARARGELALAELSALLAPPPK